ncbi:MAG: type II secretion system protein GspD, partial [Planctomycetaceae bacterium]
PVHLAPDELIALLPDRSRIFTRQIPKRNLIIIEAPREIAAQILDELTRSDQPVPQVVLEAVVCVLSPETKFQFGFDWEQGVIVNGDELLNLGLAGLSLSGTGSPIRFNDVFGDFSVTRVFLRLLAQEGYLQIRASPRVMARSGEKARISIARESFFSIQPPNIANAVLFRQDIQKVEAGIVLDIVPVIRGDHVTVMIENAEVSEDIRAQDFSNTDFDSHFPLINRRQVSTTVNVLDGHTIVIGGLMQRQVIDRVSKIPVLGDIPLVGKLFQQIDRQEEDAEVVIFISPRIVHGEGFPTAPTVEVVPAPPPGPLPAPPPVPAASGPVFQPPIPVPVEPGPLVPELAPQFLPPIPVE